MSHSVHVTDPVGGHSVTILCSDPRDAELCLEVATRHHAPILEVYRMLRVALFGLAALDDNFDPFAEFEKRQKELERDNALVKSRGASLPIDEIYEIWCRGCDAVRWSAKHHSDPAKRAQLMAFLSKQEAQIDLLLARLKRATIRAVK